ncbi:MAG: DUF2283 domain-containing protein [Armatimonadota bacterium]|jgi:uncharacterized protein YuzE
MKVIYDRETDTLSVILAEGPVAESDELREGLVIDYGRDGHIVSVEVLNASEHVTEPASIAFELKEAAAR